MRETNEACRRMVEQKLRENNMMDIWDGEKTIDKTIARTAQQKGVWRKELPQLVCPAHSPLPTHTTLSSPSSLSALKQPPSQHYDTLSSQPLMTSLPPLNRPSVSQQTSSGDNRGSSATGRQQAQTRCVLDCWRPMLLNFRSRYNECLTSVNDWIESLPSERHPALF